MSRHTRSTFRQSALFAACLFGALVAVALPGPGATQASGTVVAGWLAGLTGRTSAMPPGCAANKSARPPIAVYPVCSDQIRLFTEAMEQARQSKRLLLVDLGATWCPSCRGLQQALHDPGILGGDGRSGALAGDVVSLAIGLSTVGGGRMVEVDSGQAILTRLLAAAPDTRFRAYPMIALLDPNDDTRAVIRNLDDIVLDGARVPVEPLARLIASARDHLRQGSSAPAEPGWFFRKLSRLWQRVW